MTTNVVTLTPKPRRARAPVATPADRIEPGWIPDRGVFILRESQGPRAVRPGVAIPPDRRLDLSGQSSAGRVPPRSPYSRDTDFSARRSQRSWWRRPGPAPLGPLTILAAAAVVAFVLGFASAYASFAGFGETRPTPIHPTDLAQPAILDDLEPRLVSPKPERAKAEQ